MEEEIWKQYPNNGNYKFSNYGRCQNVKTGKLLTPYFSVNAFTLRIKLTSDIPEKNYRIHRIIAMLFVANPENYPVVTHLDGNNANNHFSNLKWIDTDQLKPKVVEDLQDEIWKEHPEIEGYEFSNFGRFKNSRTNTLLKNSLHNGHVATLLKFYNNPKRKRIRIARIVAELFVPNDEQSKNIVIHKDKDPLNNYFENLRWGTTKETVEIAIRDKKRKRSNFEKITPDEVIDIRNEYNDSDITNRELADKYKTTTQNILSIVKYRSRAEIEPEKKKHYKVNNLDTTYWELLDSKANRRRKLKNQKKMFIPENTLKEILQEYVNTPLLYKEIAKKFNIEYSALKYNLGKCTLPSVTIQDNEVFKSIADNIQISNFGRVIKDGTISNNKRFKINGTIRGLRYFVGTLFVDNPNNYLDIFCKDGDINNYNAYNLEWIPPTKPKVIKIDDEWVAMCYWNGVMVPLNDVKDQIINEYLTTNIFIPELREKYLIPLKYLIRLLRPYFKEKQHGKHYCEICKDTNPRLFYKSVKYICKLCTNDIKREERNKIKPKQKQYLGVKKQIIKPENTIKTILSRSKTRCKIKNMDYNLSEDFIIKLFQKQNARCAYSRTPIKLYPDDSEAKLFSIDRINSNRGYTMDNVVLTTKEINSMKMDRNIAEFLICVKDIYNNLLNVNPDQKIL